MLHLVVTECTFLPGAYEKLANVDKMVGQRGKVTAI